MCCYLLMLSWKQVSFKSVDRLSKHIWIFVSSMNINLKQLDRLLFHIGILVLHIWINEQQSCQEKWEPEEETSSPHFPNLSDILVVKVHTVWRLVDFTARYFKRFYVYYVVVIFILYQLVRYLSGMTSSQSSATRQIYLLFKVQKSVAL